MTVTFSEYAKAFEGIPQLPAGIVKLRIVSAEKAGPPNGPLGFRVSTRRHGVTGTKRSPPDDDDDDDVTLKLAMTLFGADIMRDCGFVVPVRSPLQLENANPESGDAEI